jgi:hypothetical protein
MSMLLGVGACLLMIGGFLAEEAAAQSVLGEVRGYVVSDSSATPLKGVQVWIEQRSAAVRRLPRESAPADPALREEIITTGLSAVSGADGSFVIANVPPGLYTVAAQLPRFESVSRKQVRVIPGLSPNIRFALVASEKLEPATFTGEAGTFRMHFAGPDGIPIDKVDVRLRGVPMLQTSNQTGVVEFRSLPAGNYLATIGRPGYERTEVPVVVRPGTNPQVEVTLQPTPIIQTLPPR